MSGMHPKRVWKYNIAAMPKPGGQLCNVNSCCHLTERNPHLPLRKESTQKPGKLIKDDLLGTYIGQMYLIGHVIGKGSFGTIRLCNPGRPKHFVVAKVELRREGKRSRLFDEFNVLQKIQGSTGFPKVYYFTALVNHNVMILDMLGPTLEELMQRVGGVFSIRTVALIGLQLMDRIEFLHDRGILYRDIKGENLLIGLFDHHNRVYLVDFGLCKHVLKEDGTQYTPVGTPRYMSLRTHEGLASTFRDDVESIGYLLIYFGLGRLPWQGLPVASTDTKIAMIRERKKRISLEELCFGLPSQFIDYIQATRNLRFNEFPDYGYFRNLLRAILRTCTPAAERFPFDWQRPGIKLTVLPKTNQPTPVSQKHEVLEEEVVDLRQTRREITLKHRACDSFKRTRKTTVANAKGSLSYNTISKPSPSKRKPNA